MEAGGDPAADWLRRHLDSTELKHDGTEGCRNELKFGSTSEPLHDHEPLRTIGAYDTQGGREWVEVRIKKQG